jgi:hypothetical protein
MTYLIGVGTVVLQIVLAVHAVRTGRTFIWVFIILLFPLLGSLIYIIAELIPEWERSNTLQRLGDSIERFLSELFPRR